MQSVTSLRAKYQICVLKHKLLMKESQLKHERMNTLTSGEFAEGMDYSECHIQEHLTNT